MILYALDIPDDPARLPGWLERHLVGMHLAELVAELSAAHAGPVSEGTTLQEALGAHLESVLEEGLGRVPPQTLQQLLREPRLLLDLQEVIFACGEAYWDRVAQQTPAGRDRVARGRRRLDAFLAAERGGHGPATLPFRPTRWYRRPLFVSLATAAAVLLAIFAYHHHGPRPEQPAGGWGWNRPGAMPDSLTASAYLENLADGAGEWFKKRPESAPEIAARVADFRKGCSTLIFAAHKPLAEDDRKWLVERCRAWAETIDKHLTELEAGEDPLRVRQDMDATVRTLINKIRERAQALA
jgi:hypothetical protein